MVTIGSIVLDDSYFPTVDISFDYFKTESGEIIGGHQVATVSASFVIGDEDGGDAINVMSRLRQIRDAGRQTKCVPISIPGLDADEGKITSLNIEEGPDPAWINQGAFTIEVRAPLKTIPANSYGIVAEDCVTEVNRIESIDIGEDSHGFLSVSDGWSKAYVRFTNSIDLKCEPLCTDGNSNNLTLRVLNKILKVGPQSSIFSQYQSWQRYLQNRSLDVSSDGSVSWKSEIILIAPGAVPDAFVDVNFESSRNFESKEKTKTISGTITGLASVNWNNPATLGGFGSSKIANALKVFGLIKAKYNTLGSWQGLLLELQEKPNCPKEDLVKDCVSDDDEDDEDSCLKPSSHTISISRTEGVINFDFEWATSDKDDCSECGGIKTEVTVEIIDPQPQFVEHVVIGREIGTLLQNLNCTNAPRLNITATSTSENSCNNLDCPADDKSRTNVRKILQKFGISISDDPNAPLDELLAQQDFIKIEHTQTTTKNSVSIKQSYIKCE